MFRRGKLFRVKVSRARESHNVKILSYRMTIQFLLVTKVTLVLEVMKSFKLVLELVPKFQNSFSIIFDLMHFTFKPHPNKWSSQKIVLPIHRLVFMFM
jgi:hypothetical protein